MLLGFFVAAFVGIWYALPMVNVVADEMYYVGGVFRALAAHSLIPLPGDVPYGTLTFYLNYIAEIPFIAVLFVVHGFSISKLMAFLVLHPESAYIVTRFVSAVLACIAIYFYNRFLRNEGVPLLQRFAALLVPTATILPEVMLHTGKMWVLSMILVMSSMLLLYKALELHKTNPQQGARAGFWSIFMAWAAFANFPLPVIFLFNIPLLAYYYRSDMQALKKLAKATIAGAVLFLAVLAINYKSIFAQIADVFTHYHPLVATASVPHISFLTSVALHTTQLFICFPLAILLLLWATARNAVKNHLLYWLSAVYALVYLALVIVVATWYTDAHQYLRYFFPFGFFFSAMVASLEISRLRKMLWTFCVIQVAIGIYILYFLSIPSTLNLARNFVDAHFSSTPMEIINSVSDLDLQENASSSLITQDTFCGSKCGYLRTHASATVFAPIVINDETDISKAAPSTAPYVMWIGNHPIQTSCPSVLMQSFITGASDSDPVDTEWGLGNYFDPGFWSRARLGENLYIYAVAPRCADTLFESLPIISATSTASQAS
jgi:hypothetical protein